MVDGGKHSSPIGNILTGLAGEYRVMSELLMRGINVARLSAQNGYDLILENGLRIEVKCAHRSELQVPRALGPVSAYHGGVFSGKHGKVGWQGKFDFLVLWCIEDEVFFVIPTDILPLGKKTCLTIYDVSGDGMKCSSKAIACKYHKYRNAWSQLLVEEVR